MSAKPTAKDSVKETKNFLSRDAESCNIDETVQSHLEEYADMSPSMAHIRNLLLMRMRCMNV